MYIIIQHFPSTSMEEEKLRNKTETGNSYSTNILESTKNIFFTLFTSKGSGQVKDG